MKSSHHCDSHSAAARLVILFVGAIGVWQAVAATVYVFTTRPVDPLVLTTLMASVGSTITALVALLGRVGATTTEKVGPTGSKDDPTHSVNENTAENPLPVTETGKEKEDERF